MPETVRRSLVFGRAVGVAIASAALCGGLAAAQATAVPQRPAKANGGRPSGTHPDLQGVWGSRPSHRFSGRRSLPIGRN